MGRHWCRPATRAYVGHVSNSLTGVARRQPASRRGQTAQRLLDAALAELESRDPDEVTVRTVAASAGVSPATAYNYFASREHLFAEVFSHHLERHAPARLTGTPTARLQQTTRHLSVTIASAPHLAAAATKSLLGNDPDVERLRVRIGTLMAERFRTALAPGDKAIDKRVLETLLLAFFGALLQTGMGLLTYPELADRLDEVVAVIMKGHA